MGAKTTEQNYPNTFNPSTIIVCSLQKSAFVSLTVYKTLSQIAATFVNESKQLGYYTVQWNVGVPSGIYYYRMRAGEYVETKKMALSR
jgi:hypothetical protein